MLPPQILLTNLLYDIAQTLADGRFVVAWSSLGSATYP